MNESVKTTATIWAMFFVLGAGAMFGIDRYLSDKGLRELKAHADSVQVASAVRESVTTRYADSLRNEVVWLQNTKAPVVVKIVKDSADASRAARAVAEAKTVGDSNMALVVEVAALASEVAGLRLNARTDSLSLFQAMARGDVLQDSLHAQSRAIADLNARIQALHPRPTLALKILKGASYVAAVVVGYEAGKKK